MELLEMLRCPGCAGLLKSSEEQHDPGFDVWRCSCNKWPVVNGIPVLSRPLIFPARQRLENIVSLIEGRQYRKALLSLLMLPPAVPALAPRWVQRFPPVVGIRRLQRLLHEHRLESWTSDAIDLLLDPTGTRSACHFFDLRFIKSTQPTPTAYEYFTYRFGQPRHLVALSFMTLLDRTDGPVLDLGCGPGHMIFAFLGLKQTRSVIGIDRDFTMLHIAKQRIAPGGHYICMDADQPLPFRNGFLSGVLCSDAFHYFAQKTTAAAEMLRTVHQDGVIALAVVRNSNFDYQQSGLPLAPEEYSRLFDSVPHKILRDDDVLASYLQKRGPQLEASASAESLKRSPTLSLIASARADLFGNSEKFAGWPHAMGELVVNPLYRVNADSQEIVRLQRDFPSEWFALDHPELKEYLPERGEVSLETLRRLAMSEHSDEAEDLIQHCAILGMPERYGTGTTVANLLKAAAGQSSSSAGGDEKSEHAA